MGCSFRWTVNPYPTGPLGPTAFEGQTISLASVCPEDVRTDMAKAGGLPHDSGIAQIDGAETANLASSSNSVGSSVSVDESIGNFMLPLDIFPSSDADIAITDPPSSEFDSGNQLTQFSQGV
ncbi:hypothetical protein PCL_02795 [Purpureocillium lilacinum]|uniref:Uncharacterized protein n=1 Tax=Purpureocillium lilacinum TaxID=33203 RepID=A0A2U3DNV7_PURLI|nr:hypothetical protein PCL_02795 [Purpureocillium lilacinum]